jgi:hypothetical protein
MEAGMARSEYGGQVLEQYIAMVVDATTNTMNSQALRGLIKGSTDHERRTYRMNHLRGKTAWDCLQAEVTFYGFLQKLNNPFKAVESKLVSEMSIVGGQYDSLILPSQARSFVESNPAFTEYMKAGPAGTELLRSDFHAPATNKNYPGVGDSVRVYSLPPNFHLNELTGNVDIMSHISAIGEYYVIDNSTPWDSERWTPAQQTIELWDHEQDDYFPVHLSTVIDKSGLFDEAGHVRPLSSLTHDAPADLPNDDMFTVDGLPVKIFGDIKSEHLSAYDRKKWARAAINQMNRNNGNTSIDLMSSKLLSSLQAKANENVPQDYFSEFNVADGSVLVSELKRAFGSSGYVTDDRVFLSNVLLPNFLPAFNVSGGDKADTNKNPAYKSFVKALFAKSDATPNNDEVVLAAKKFAMFTVSANQADRPSDVATTNAARDDIESRYAGLSGKLKSQAEKLYDQTMKKWSEIKSVGGPGVEWTPAPGYYFSPKQLEFLAQKLSSQADDTQYQGIPYMPADPEFPGIPMDAARLKSVLGNADMKKKWNLDKQTIASAFHQHTPFVKELAHQALHSQTMAEEHRYSEHVASHAYLSSRASFGLRSLLSDMQSINAPVHPSKFDVSKFDNELLVSLTSEEYGKHMDELFAIASPAERIVATLFNTSRVTRDTINRWTAAKFPLPFGGLLFRPDITHVVGGGLAVLSGGRTGYMAVGKPLWMNGSNADQQSYGAHLSIYSAAVIKNPENIYQIPAALLQEYVGGHSDQWIDLNRDDMMDRNRDRRESLYGVVIPAGHGRRIPQVLSITGDILHDQFLAEAGCTEPKSNRSFPQAYRFVKTTGTYDRYKQEPQTAENGGIKRNILCLRGPWRFLDIDGRAAIKRGQGHLGSTSRPGAKAVRSNGYTQYPSEDGINFV